jgi:hypothetical protein
MTAGGGPKCPTPKKYRHASKAAAQRALESLADSRPLGPDWNVYRCVCGVWHVGHKRGSLQQRIKDALRKEPRR